jgi:hypothetical protein
MLKKYLFVMLCFTAFSCKEKNEKDFKTFASDFVKEYAMLFPDETPLSKENEKLAFLALPTPSYFDSVKMFHQRFSTDLQQFDVQNPAFPNSRDALKVANILKGVGGYVSDYNQNPLRFNVLHGFKRIFESNYTTDAERLQTIFNKLEYVPAFYEAAKRQLAKADRTSSDAAIEQHIQTFLFFEDTLTDMLNNRNLMTPQYLERIEAAKLAIKDYIAFVESFRVQ